MNSFEKIMALAYKKGIFYPTAEIYGGLAGFYDYGSIGTRILKKWKELWIDHFVDEDNFHELETNLILPYKALKASGHVDNFYDPVIKCKKCGEVYRLDHLIEEKLGINVEGKTLEEMENLIRENNLKCPKCGSDFEKPEIKNLMFQLEVGIKNPQVCFLRPETAQSAFLNFKREYKINRDKLPLGLAIIGKSFRNEISPRNGLFRLREFRQAELQVFFHENDLDNHDRYNEVKDEIINVLFSDGEEKEIKINDLELPKRYKYYLGKVKRFFDKVGLKKIRFRELGEEERAFYNKIHFDVEYYFECFEEYKEIAGIHYRTDHDLKGHQEFSGEKILKEIPHVIEISFGVDRNIFALLDQAYCEEEDRIVLKLNKNVSPYLVGVYPLLKKDGLPEKAKEIYSILKEKYGKDVFYDESGTIGKRYYRSDEIGIPFGITVDHQTLEDETFTLRLRDSKEQIRIKVEEIDKYL
jgi:glycyl-tRNA synthetase